MKRLTFLLFLCSHIAYGQSNLIKNVSAAFGAKPDAQKNFEDSIAIRTTKIDGNLYFLDCINGFGGGNVAASIGDDGILLVDDMYAMMAPKLKDALKVISNKPVKIVLNTHFHWDHIEGIKAFQSSSVIIAQENVSR